MEGNARLYLKDPVTGVTTNPIPALNAFEIESAGVTTDQKYLVVNTNEDGYGVLHIYNLPAFTEVKLPAIERGVVSVSSMRNNTIIWTVSSSRSASVSYSWTIGSSEIPKPVTAADTNGLDLTEFQLPELVKFSSFDGTSIPAFLYLPPGFKKGKPIPFVVAYHGGPEGQWRPQFDRTSQILTHLGFGVIQPNVRGSTGYGRAFQMMDDYKKRWDSVRDGVDAAKWLVDNGYATAGKISTYGGSYGGFMSVATLIEDQERVEKGTQTARLFGAGIDVVGIVNMKTFLEQTSGYRRKLRESEYGPLTDPAFLATVSSINRVDKIKVPMMIAHGLNDPRVPVGEAMQLAVALQSRGYDPELVFCPDEGHGFAKLPNRILFSTRMANFLLKNIGPDSR
jgi:dipeptidyl aminopeptidase/acylaminoacyl peptidase